MAIGSAKYKPGEKLQASTINDLILNTGITTQNGFTGGGLNMILNPPLNKQSMADLTHSAIAKLKTHSIVYCSPLEPDEEFLWTTTKRTTSQAYYTQNNTIMKIKGTKKKDGTASSSEGKRMIALEPMISGGKYVLRCQSGLKAGDACAWDGEKLIKTVNKFDAEFFVQRYIYIPTPPDFTSAANYEDLFDPRRGTYSYPPQHILYEYANTVPRKENGKWIMFADIMFPDMEINGVLPGFPSLKNYKIHNIGQAQRPMTYKNPTNQAFVEVVYRPTDQAEEETGTATVTLPIYSAFIGKPVIPRPNGTWDSEGVYLPTRSEYGYLFGWESNCLRYSAGLLAAKSMGMIFPDTATKQYQLARYCSTQRVHTIRWEETSGKTPTKIPEDLSSKYDVKAEWSFVALATSKSGENSYLWKGNISYLPSPTGEYIYPDIYSETIPVYVTRLVPYAEPEVKLARFLFSGVDDIGEVNLGCVDYVYDYDDSPELIEIPRPNCPGSFIRAASDGDCFYSYGNTTFQLPRQDPKEALPDCDFEWLSCDGNGTSVWRFTPKYMKYDALEDFPFFAGLTPKNAVAITFDKRKAQLANYPAYAPTLDYGEFLNIGEKVSYTIKTVQFTYTVRKTIEDPSFVDPEPDPTFVTHTAEWKYAEVVPTDIYHTEISGTPALSLVRCERVDPTTDEIQKGIINDNDYWVHNWCKIDFIPITKIPLTTYMTLLQTDDGVPILREPYGAFNDCNNVGNLGLFIKVDSEGRTYACTCHLDYIPYGYAVPSKTPSCFYKATAADNCAPRLKGITYDIVRQNGILSLKGGCYIPCSSLTQF